MSKLKGLGPKTEKYLNEIGIYSKDDLVKIGAVNAYIKLQKESRFKPSMNFLYAMVGAVENVMGKNCKIRKGTLIDGA
ncbi:MAG: TfoX/Sxy family DNA transformation protein [Methylococcaceae bacterium]